MIPNWAKDYIGIPYQSKGDSLAGADCYGLVRLVNYERYDRLLPNHNQQYITADDSPSVSQAVKRNLPNWVETNQPEPGGVAVFNIAGHPVHIGLILDHEFMLHSLLKHDSAVERFTHPKWFSRLVGFYSWR